MKTTTLFLLIWLYSTPNYTHPLGIDAYSTQQTLADSSKVKWIGETEYPFPTMTKGARVEHIFYFKNISKDSLIIDNVRTDCGCTASDWDIQATPPSGTGKIVVQFHARSTGSFKEKIAVWIRGQRKSEKLYITGEVE